jgi:alpha-glucoside transport system substrate-binding protein
MQEFQDSRNGTCGMLQQASFYSSMFPCGTTFGPGQDADAFYLPPTNTKFGKPIMGAGEFPVSFSKRKVVGFVQDYLSSPVYGTMRAEMEWMDICKQRNSSIFIQGSSA